MRRRALHRNVIQKRAEAPASHDELTELPTGDVLRFSSAPIVQGIHNVVRSSKRLSNTMQSTQPLACSTFAWSETQDREKDETQKKEEQAQKKIFETITFAAQRSILVVEKKCSCTLRS
jgi:hypothetical protein